MRRLAIAAAVVALVTLVAGCSDSGSGSKPVSTITITFKGDTVTPQGKRVEIAAGKPVTLVVKADKPGEIHVHSSPEQQLAYQAGTTRLKLTIDQPGLVEVESHTLEKTILQLEAK
jgi:hypothetical protein